MTESQGRPEPGMAPQVAPNWYPDPHQPGRLRYWDGAAWTSHISDAVVAESFPPPPVGERKGMSTGAIVGIVVGCLVLVLIVLPVIAAVAIPIFFSQREKAEDSAAKADVSMLGREVATHFVDNSQLPSITVEGNNYVIVGGNAPVTVNRSTNVELGGIDGTGATDWCVWVSNPEGNLKDFRYSAQHGLEPGYC